MAALIEEALLAKVVLVTARFPSPDVFLVEIFAVPAELLDNPAVRDVIIEHLIELVADFLWEPGDRAVAGAARDGSGSRVGGFWIRDGISGMNMNLVRAV